MPRSIFLSYSSKDKAVADLMCQAMEQNGLKCWIAPRDIMPGQDWSEAIIDGLTSARVFVLLLSETSNVSEQVKREIQNAVTEGLTIVPFRIHDVTLTKHMRYFIGTPHWLDAFQAPIEPHLQTLVEVVGSLLRSRVPGIAPDVSTQTAQGYCFDARQYDAPPQPLPPQVQPHPLAQPTPIWAATPEEVAIIKSELAAFVGPISSVMVNREVANATDQASLCEQLSRYLSTPDEAKRFLEGVKRHLIQPQQQAQSAAAAPAPVPVAAPAVVWDDEKLKLVEHQFAEFIGPLASVVVKRTLPKANNMEELYQLLSEKLDSPAEQEKFRRLRPTK